MIAYATGLGRELSMAQSPGTSMLSCAIIMGEVARKPIIDGMPRIRMSCCVTPRAVCPDVAVAGIY